MPWTAPANGNCSYENDRNRKDLLLVNSPIRHYGLYSRLAWTGQIWRVKTPSYRRPPRRLVGLRSACLVAGLPPATPFPNVRTEVLSGDLLQRAQTSSQLYHAHICVQDDTYSVRLYHRVGYFDDSDPVPPETNS